MPGTLTPRPTSATRERAIRNMGRALLLLREAQRHDIAGRGYAELRRKIADGRIDAKPVPRQIIEDQYAVISAVRRSGMPAPRELVRVMLETACFRWGAVPERVAWRIIGMTAHRGNNIVHRGSPITWPEWCILWDASLGPAHHISSIPRHVQKGAIWEPGQSRRTRGPTRKKTTEDAA